jgi:hypothetical protein
LTALMAFTPGTYQLVPLDVREQLCLLLLQAQRMEAAGVECYFQLGINVDFLEKVDD